jgi:hypothetical protein
MREVSKLSDVVLTMEKVLEEAGLIAIWEARGEAIGEEKRAIEIARNLLAKGWTVEEIVDVTKLDKETIKGLGPVRFFV